MADIPTYGHIDIKRYLQKQMTPQEMHAFEKAMMDDPFLADAMEGYAAGSSATADKHLSEIERNLLSGSDKAKVVVMAGGKTSWWKVAAIVIVIVTGSALFYTIINTTETGKTVNRPMATIESSQEMSTTADSISPAENESPKTGAISSQEIFNPGKKNSPVINPPRERSLAANTPAKNEEVNMLLNQDDNEHESENKNMAAAPSAAGNIINDDSRKRASTVALNEFKGRVTDAIGQPVPFASVRADNAKTVTDAQGNFTLKANDTVVKVDINSVGYATAKKELRQSADKNIISLQETDADLSEVVVTGLTSRKNKTAKSTTNETTTAEPVGGWNNFRMYVSQQLDSLTAVNVISRYNDNVVVEFFINKAGEPTDIKVLKDAGSHTAEKAVQIISNGPKWKSNKKENKVKLTIPF